MPLLCISSQKDTPLFLLLLFHSSQVIQVIDSTLHSYFLPACLSGFLEQITCTLCLCLWNIFLQHGQLRNNFTFVLWIHLICIIVQDLIGFPYEKHAGSPHVIIMYLTLILNAFSPQFLRSVLFVGVVKSQMSLSFFEYLA